MAKKSSLGGDEADAHRGIRVALPAWNEDRKEWADRAMRSLAFVNAGGAVVITAFIGTAIGGGKFLIPDGLFSSLRYFLLGLVISLTYAVYRFLWAEFRIWYLRWKRAVLFDDSKKINPKKIMTKLPPTRWQLAFTYIANVLCFLFFVGGIWSAFNSLPGLLPVFGT